MTKIWLEKASPRRHWTKRSGLQHHYPRTMFVIVILAAFAVVCGNGVEQSAFRQTDTDEERELQFFDYEVAGPTPSPLPLANVQTEQSVEVGLCGDLVGRPRGCTCDFTSQCVAGLHCILSRGLNFCLEEDVVVTDMPITNQIQSTNSPTKSPITSLQKNCLQPQDRQETCPCSVNVSPPQCAFGLECISTNGVELCFVDSSTEKPSTEPSLSPSRAPSNPPSSEPTRTPVPTVKPTFRPTRKPTVSPRPTRKPSPAPSAQPTKSPRPTRTTANQQTQAPTVSRAPSASPTRTPSSAPNFPVECRTPANRPVSCPCTANPQCVTNVCVDRTGKCDF